MGRKKRPPVLSGYVRIVVSLKNVVISEEKRKAAREGAPMSVLSLDLASDQELTDSIYAISKSVFDALTDIGVPETAITAVFKEIKRQEDRDTEAN